MSAIVYDIFTKARIITHDDLNLPDGLPDELIKLIKRMPERRDYILSCQDADLPNYVGYCLQYSGKDADRTKCPFPVPNYKSTAKTVGMGILNGQEADSFAYMDRKYKVTFNSLNSLKTIYTRSDLVAHDEYIGQLNKNVKIFVVYNTVELTDEDYTHRMDSKWGGCPSYKRRVKAVEKLKALGFKAELITEEQFIKKLKLNKVG